MGYAFQADSRQHFVAPVFQSVVALRIELSAARLSAEHGQPALDDLLVKSGTSGSNRKPPGPKPGVLPTAPLPDIFCDISSPYGLSLRLESAVSWADRRTGRVVVLCAHTSHAVDWEALESSSPALQAGAIPSQLPVRGRCNKKTRGRCDTGFCVICSESRVSQAQGMLGQRFRLITSEAAETS